MSTSESTNTARLPRARIDILLIDDDIQIRTVLLAALQKQGYTVLVAPEGKTALGYCLRYTFRLVITDIFMPVMDGIEVIMNSSAAGRKTPILAMSGGSAFGGPEFFLKPAGFLGCRKTLAKPFEMREFLSAVEELVGAN